MGGRGSNYRSGGGTGVGGGTGGTSASLGGGGTSRGASGITLGVGQTQNPNPNQQQTAPATTTMSAQSLVDASKVASLYGNNTVTMFSGMTDDQMAKTLVNPNSVGMPNHLADRYDRTQSFVFANQLNAKPTVMDDAEFDKFKSDNGIPDSAVLIREVNPIQFQSGNVKYTYTADDVTDMFKTSDVNYIGGKVGGQAYGAGTYFEQAGKGGRTGYGSVPMMAVFNPKTARIIPRSDISSAWTRFSASHPKTASAFNRHYMSNDISVKALLMGYNVITSASNSRLSGNRGDYYNIIDRSALVVRARNGNT